MSTMRQLISNMLCLKTHTHIHKMYQLNEQESTELSL